MKIADAGTTFPHLGIFGSIAGKPVETARPEDEFLHPPPASNSYRASESNYLGFNIPEHQINAELYVWFHPVLRVMSTSIYIYRGLKGSTLECEYVKDFRYLPFPTHGIEDFSIEEAGIRYKVLEPMKSMLIEHQDPKDDVSFTLRYDAIMPAAVRPGGFHFTQAVKTSGELNLRGKKYTINGFFSRDRSWGQERSEDGLRIPPLSWSVGVIDETFAFHSMGMDSPELNPHWLERYPLHPGHNLCWGYVYRDEQTFALTGLRQFTNGEADGFLPRSIEMELTDAGGQKHEFYGVVTARYPWLSWPQMTAYMCLTRWQGKRGVAWGDVQYVVYNEYTRFRP